MGKKRTNGKVWEKVKRNRPAGLIKDKSYLPRTDNGIGRCQANISFENWEKKFSVCRIINCFIYIYIYNDQQREHLRTLKLKATFG